MPASCRRHAGVIAQIRVQKRSLRSSLRFKTVPVWSLLPAWRLSGLSWAPVSIPGLYPSHATVFLRDQTLAERCVSFQADSTAEAVTGELNRKAAEQSAPWSENSWGHHIGPSCTRHPVDPLWGGSTLPIAANQELRSLAGECWRFCHVFLLLFMLILLTFWTAVSKLDWGVASPVGREGKASCRLSQHVKTCFEKNVVL